MTRSHRFFAVILLTVTALPVSPAYAVLGQRISPDMLWTAQDVEAACTGRWQGMANSTKSCIARNKRKIGHPKHPADLQEIEMGNQYLSGNKPAQAAASAVPAPATPAQ